MKIGANKFEKIQKFFYREIFNLQILLNALSYRNEIMGI
jgi:hypothetical protein